MIKIAHRGNFKGPNPETENSPISIGAAIAAGFQVECDVWMNESGIFLGHDAPRYRIDEGFLQDVSEESWFHCKNIEALGWFSNNMPRAKFFWHQNDDYTLTSNGYIWTYPGKTITNNSIIVLDKKFDLDLFKNAYGVCSDYLY